MLVPLDVSSNCLRPLTSPTTTCHRHLDGMMPPQRARLKASGILVTHRKVSVTRYCNGRKKTKWVNVPLVPPPTSPPNKKKKDISAHPHHDGPPQDEMNLNAMHPEGHIADAAKERTYAENKFSRSSSWEEIIYDLRNAHLSSLAPLDRTCSLCNEDHSNITLCQDCGPTAYFCPKCCLRQHLKAPLHFPLIWQGQVYVPFKFPKKLSIPGHKCPGYVKPANVTVIDQNGRHHLVEVQFCSCVSKSSTLIYLNLWPATPTNPTIAIHLRFMDLCRFMLLEGAVAVNKFVTAMTMFATTLPSDGFKVDLYRSLAADCAAYHRRFAYILNHLEGVVQGYPDGTDCPTCSETADSLPKVVSMDGNFRLVRKVTAGSSDYPPQHNNRFFLPKEDVEPFLLTTAVAHNQGCSQFSAGDESRSKFQSKNLDVTGVFGSICVHDHPQFFIDMTSGEKLGYAVSIINKLLADDETRDLKILYDVACRLLPQLKNAHLDYSRVDLAVPLFHGYSHIMKCQTLYNPRNIPGFRTADGENTERLWSYLGRFVYITREMTPSNRRDLLVDALLHWSQKSLKSAVPKMMKRLQNAKDTEKKTKEELATLSGALREEGIVVNEATVSQWERDIKSQYNPYRKQGPDWREEYAVVLNKFFSLRWRVLDIPLESEELEAKSELKRVADELERTEASRKFTRWTAESHTYKTAIQKALDRKADEHLQKLIQESTERRQLIHMKTKARCHARASKLSEQIKRTNGRITRMVRQYNTLSDRDNITVETANDPSSPIFASVNYTSAVPNPLCREAILKFNILERTEEEAHCIPIEMQGLLVWYKHLHSLLQEQISLMSPPANEAQLGATALLLYHLLANEKYQLQITEELKRKFSIQETPEKHYSESGIHAVFFHVGRVPDDDLTNNRNSEHADDLQTDEVGY